jgi:hypothetical protein
MEFYNIPQHSTKFVIFASFFLFFLLLLCFLLLKLKLPQGHHLVTLAANTMGENEDPLQLAQTFWKAMCTKDGMKIINPMLSPDCYLKDGFGTSARGVHELEAISAKLTEISGKISGGAATFETDIPFRVMRNKVQVRFLTTAKVGWISISIGFALEFECGFIIKIVLMKNPGKGVFETDDTQEAAPKKVAVVMEEQSISPPDSSVSEKKESSIDKSEDTDTIDESADTHEEINVIKGKNTDQEEVDHSYYFGKFLGRERPVQEGKVEDSEPEEDGAAPVPLAQTLHPPYLCSKPPQIPPTVVVTVVGCMHLESPLVRVIEREVNAYVSVQMKNMPVIQSTPTAKNGGGPNPMFTTSNKFVFEAPPAGGTIMFTVYDKKSVGGDLVIAEVHVPLASIATTSPSNSTPTSLSLPLHLLKQVSRFRKQKHRPSISGGTTAADTDTNEPEGSLGQLDVQISKIDIMKWWALEELKARDAALDQKEAEEEARQKEEAEKQAEERGLLEKKDALKRGFGKTVDADIKECQR